VNQPPGGSPTEADSGEETEEDEAATEAAACVRRGVGQRMGAIGFMELVLMAWIVGSFGGRSKLEKEKADSASNAHPTLRDARTAAPRE
jgi:hypothetical protein